MHTNSLPVDVGEVISWQQALVAVALILAVLVWPGFLMYMNSKVTRSNADAIRTTLTTNNGGSTVKDALDRIERGLGEIEVRLDKLEGEAPEAS